MSINSPVQEIIYAGTSIWVKRDDLIDPFISGNKWRKLKYILADARTKHKTHLVTFGGAYSNHVLATAAAAARNGLKSTAFIRGEAVENESLLLCKLFGMRLIFIAREAYKSKKTVFDNYFGQDETAYFIDEGGAGPEGAKGCSEVLEELTENFDHLFCAAGTGTTAAGLLSGIAKLHLKTQLHVVPVLKGGEFLQQEITDLSKHTTGLQLHYDYHFGGYAKTTPELIDFVKKFVAATGLLIEPVYTAKMFYAIYDLKRKGFFKKDAKILALHTGGLMGIFGKKDELLKKN